VLVEENLSRMDGQWYFSTEAGGRPFVILNDVSIESLEGYLHLTGFSLFPSLLLVNSGKCHYPTRHSRSEFHRSEFHRSDDLGSNKA
jgi:hypothetical protein